MTETPQQQREFTAPFWDRRTGRLSNAAMSYFHSQGVLDPNELLNQVLVTKNIASDLDVPLGNEPA